MLTNRRVNVLSLLFLYRDLWTQEQRRLNLPCTTRETRKVSPHSCVFRVLSLFNVTVCTQHVHATDTPSLTLALFNFLQGNAVYQNKEKFYESDDSEFSD